MWSRLFARGLEIDLGNGPVRYRTPADLSLALGGRTGPSSTKLAAYAALADETLMQESERHRAVEQLIARALAQAPASGPALSEALVDLDLSLVTEDRNWRGVLRALRSVDDRDGFKRVAMQKYLEYLGAGQELILAIRDGRRGPNASRREQTDDLSPRQMLIFDLDSLVGADRVDEPDEFNRLPKGETLEVALAAHQSLSLLLARYRFTLVAGNPYIIVDENGNDLRLRAGKNIVGRSMQCDVPLDPTFRSVSRKHVIVEADRPGLVKLTDISTLGTFVPRAHLDNRLH